MNAILVERELETLLSEAARGVPGARRRFRAEVEPLVELVVRRQWETAAEAVLTAARRQSTLEELLPDPFLFSRSPEADQCFKPAPELAEAPPSPGDLSPSLKGFCRRVMARLEQRWRKGAETVFG